LFRKNKINHHPADKMSGITLEDRRVVLSLIQKPVLSVEDVRYLVGEEFAILIGRPQFVIYLDRLITLLTQDRDGNNRFTLEDVRLLLSDPLAMTVLITALLLVIQECPSLGELKYQPGVTESFVYRILLYVFLVLIPKKLHRQWEQPEAVLDLIVLLYNSFVSSQVVKQAVEKVLKWIREKVVSSRLNSCLPCCSLQSSTQPTVAQTRELITERLPTTEKKLARAIEFSRHITLTETV
jgi:hypothetical protein